MVCTGSSPIHHGSACFAHFVCFLQFFDGEIAGDDLIGKLGARKDRDVAPVKEVRQ